MSKLLNFFTKEFFQKIYVWIIIILFYIPIFFGLVFSFNKESNKGDVSLSGFNDFSVKGWLELVENDHIINGFVNSLLIAICVSVIVIIFSLITVFAIWRQKNKTIKAVVNSTSSIPLVNPDIITAVGLTLVLSTMFGVLSASSEGFERVVLSHTIMTLPYGILFMYPRSEKFSKSIFEASQDLGFSLVKTWFKTYLIYMMPSILFTFAICTMLSFDDFVITRVVSNTSTLATLLYEGKFKVWSLSLGSIALFIVAFINIGYVLYDKWKNKGKVFK